MRNGSVPARSNPEIFEDFKPICARMSLPARPRGVGPASERARFGQTTARSRRARSQTRPNGLVDTVPSHQSEIMRVSPPRRGCSPRYTILAPTVSASAQGCSCQKPLHIRSSDILLRGCQRTNRCHDVAVVRVRRKKQKRDCGSYTIWMVGQQLQGRSQRRMSSR